MKNTSEEGMDLIRIILINQINPVINILFFMILVKFSLGKTVL